MLDGAGSILKGKVKVKVKVSEHQMDSVLAGGPELDQYIVRIQEMMVVLYGDSLRDFVETLNGMDLTCKRLIYLCCLHREKSMQDYERTRSGTKLDVFLGALDLHTKELLDFKQEIEEYVQLCLESYVVS